VSLFDDGRILFTYDAAQLTSTALSGISPGGTQTLPALDNFASPPPDMETAPIADLFSTTMRVDDLGAIQAFYAAHPGNDVYDFVYFMTDFDFDLGDAFAFYLPIRNDEQGIGQTVFDNDPDGTLGSFKIQGELNLGNIVDAYPDLPTTRFLDSNHTYSVIAQEQGHRWLADIAYPGAPLLLLGRDNEHWSFFFNTESNVSSAAARRSSSMEGNVWRNNGDGSFTSTGLIDGYSRLDQYIMGLRAAGDVPDSFALVNLTNTAGATRATGPTPNVTITGQAFPVTIGAILSANGARLPGVASAQENFRTALVLLTQPGAQPAQKTLDKITRLRLGWESYFAQATDYLATLNTGLSNPATSRVVAAASAASFGITLAPGEITALFGAGLATDTATASSQPLPTSLANTQVFVNGAPAALFFVSPGQINFEVPPDVTATTSQPSVSSASAFVEVISDGQLTRAGVFQIAPTVPAIFTLTQNGSGPAAALDAFTGAGAPFSATQADGQPNILSLFGTGLGADVTDVSGNVSGSVQVTIDGVPATVPYAGNAPGFSGLNQLNIVLPAGITSGAHTVLASRNGITANPVTIAIQ
jgi:uncharacterized protein (TIGR03437 family)